MEDYDKVNPIEDFFDKEEEERIMKELSKIDGLQEYLRAVMARDMRMHFESKKEDQDIIRGGYFRTRFFAKLISKNSN